jgi:DNA ligase-1
LCNQSAANSKMAKQATLMSFFTGKSAAAVGKPSKKLDGKANDRVGVTEQSSSMEDKEGNKTADDSEEEQEEQEEINHSIKPKRRKVIVDDEDSDENNFDESLPLKEKEECNDEAVNDVKEDQKMEPEAAKPLKSSSLISPESLNNQSSTAIKTDEALLSSNSQYPYLWKAGEPIPYAALCHTFARIEEVSSRLMIQQHLTELFRQVLLLTPQDLVHLIYLSSNTVAPSYECVELGVGDSILIKAVGESFGTNPSLIKQSYNKQGDLGKVAETAKSSQRTLNFATKAPKSLTAKEVLHTFRQIATNTTQKYKVEKIKNLLVRCAKNAQEAKFVIRGLQGKLRIGLAQSTVLISLAHALLLTQSTKIPPASSCTITDEDDEDEETNNMAAKILRNSKVPIEEKLECAVKIIKKAYSELPSFDAIVDASLKTPLYKLHHVCTLKPGIPVEPMLAKPTKSCAEVLKRLNGLRFTCEFKVRCISCLFLGSSSYYSFFLCI